MKFKNPYLDNVSKLDLLAKWIIVHSALYYELDTSVVDDFAFDSNCKQFLALRRLVTPQEFKRCKWYYVMQDFDGSTGFHLYKRLKLEHRIEVLHLAEWLSKIQKED